MKKIFIILTLPLIVSSHNLFAQTKFDTLSFKFNSFGNEKNVAKINLHLKDFKYGNFPATKIGAASGALCGFAIGYFGSLHDKNNFLGPTVTGIGFGFFGAAIGGLIGATLDEFVFIY
jgi:uncharacterized membrane protein